MTLFSLPVAPTRAAAVPIGFKSFHGRALHVPVARRPRSAGRTASSSTTACRQRQAWDDLADAVGNVPSGKRARDAASAPAGSLRRQLADGGFPLLVEALPPRGTSELDGWAASFAALAGRLPGRIAAFSPFGNGNRAGSLASAALLERRTGGDLLGACALGVRQVLAVTGDPAPHSPHQHPHIPASPDAAAAPEHIDPAFRRAVFNFDSFKLISLMARLRDEGLGFDGTPAAVPPELLVGAAANPCGPPSPEDQARRTAAKIAAGADFFATQPVLDAAAFAAFHAALRDLGVPERSYFIAGVPICTSVAKTRNMLQAWTASPPGAEWAWAREVEDRAEFRRRGRALAVQQARLLREAFGADGVLLYPLCAGEADLLESVEEVAAALSAPAS
eukprot:tig00000626_g2665.t1